jgi:DNA gyrase/topoisomerase IV subunit B
MNNKTTEKNRRYYETHKETCKEATKRWCEANPERLREIRREATRAFRARKKAEAENPLVNSLG